MLPGQAAARSGSRAKRRQWGHVSRACPVGLTDSPRLIVCYDQEEQRVDGHTDDWCEWCRCEW